MARDVAAGLGPGEGGVVLDAAVRERAHAYVLVHKDERMVADLVAVATRFYAQTGRETPAFHDILELAAIASWGSARSIDSTLNTPRMLPANAPRIDDPRPNAHRGRVRI